VVQATLPQLDSQRDPDTTARLLAFTSAACSAIARTQPTACASSLGAVYPRVVPLLVAPADGARRAAVDALMDMTTMCVPAAAAHAEQQQRAAGAEPGGLARAVAALVAALQPGYLDAWPLSVPVATEMLRALGPAGGALAAPLLRPLSDMCRGSTDAAESTSLAHAAIGAAIAAQGPRAVLEVLPLSLDNLEACDVWLLGLLRKHTAQAELRLWGEYVLPRARAFGEMTNRAQAAGAHPWHLLESALCWMDAAPGPRCITSLLTLCHISLCMCGCGLNGILQEA
jgi:NUC173 domain